MVCSFFFVHLPDLLIIKKKKLNEKKTIWNTILIVMTMEIFNNVYHPKIYHGYNTIRFDLFYVMLKRRRTDEKKDTYTVFDYYYYYY